MATQPAYSVRARSLLDALHGQPPVQGQAAHAGARVGHVLRNARGPEDSRRRRRTVVRQRRPRTHAKSPKPWRASSRPWTTPRRSRWGIPAAFELANALVRIAPAGLDHVFFTNSGSESVDTALKIALAYHRVKGDAARTRLIGRERGYHGVGFGGISVGGMVANRKAWPASMIPGVDHLPHTHDLKRNAFSRGLPAHGAELADELERLVDAARCLDHRRRHRRAHRRLHRRRAAAAGLSAGVCARSATSMACC